MSGHLSDVHRTIREREGRQDPAIHARMVASLEAPRPGWIKRHAGEILHCFPACIIVHVIMEALL